MFSAPESAERRTAPRFTSESDICDEVIRAVGKSCRYENGILRRKSWGPQTHGGYTPVSSSVLFGGYSGEYALRSSSR